MPSNPELLKQIETALAAFDDRPLFDASLGLFATLGYRSERRMKLRSADAPGFLGTFDRGQTLNRERALLADWQAVEFLFQLTDAEVQSATTGIEELAFGSTGRFDGAEINSFLFLAIGLRPAAAREGERKGQPYTRTELAGVTRAVNRLFDMPVLLVFKHGGTVSLGIIHRRLSKRDSSKDVLEKVTLIKDIAFADPIRAHVEILHDFALPQLLTDYGVANFVALHAAWQKRLGSYALSNSFYREIADWYFWARHLVDDGAIRLPQHCDTEQEKSLFLIRLLTRVIFSWFLVEKRLIPTDLFREHRLKALLKDFNPSRDPSAPDSAPTYYHAILQNLFFGTLNMPADQRGFRKRSESGGRDQNFGVTNLWRHEANFRNPADWTRLAARVPFLNGGLFDCLDDKSGKKQDNFILDGFSDNPKLACHLPNDLFFGPERTVDLSRDYGEEDKRTARSKRARVRGLIEILSRYKFTIEENTPLEEEIALDPELLGKVFENLLASYNEDTRTTARKALGAFYTPREIVSYMVDEALKSYLQTQMVGQTFLSASSVPPSALATTQRRLPHWKKDGAIYWITFRLADSLPQEKLHAWREQREIWKSHHPEPWSEQDWAEYDERFGRKLDEWLDAGMGSHALARPEVRDAVKNCLLRFDGERLQVHSAVIMPNHVHALIEPLQGHDLSTLLKGIKGASAREANKLLGTSGTFWLDESYDHIVRSEEQYRHFLRYIAENPKKAELHADQYWLYEGGADIPVCHLLEGEVDISVCLSAKGSQTGMSAPPSGNRHSRMSASLSKRLDALFTTKAEPPQFTPAERDALIAAIGRVKILDPACGSGAFPMGALHRLVDLLQKLDPNNESWKRDRLAEARRYRALLEQSGTDIPVCGSGAARQTGMSASLSELAACDARIADIEKSFDTRYHALDFARKLYLIENSIYGVDIQPIATQIAKLRFFISLVVDQKVEGGPEGGADIPVCQDGKWQTGMSAPPWNMGIRPLPNLETRFVAADTLIPIEKSESDLFSKDLDRLRSELAEIRHGHFNARSPAAKRKWREADEAKRREISAMLEDSHALSKETSRKLAAWDPYDQNAHAPFFDSEWMFGIKGGIQGGADIPVCDSPQRQTRMSAPPSEGPFDIVIGNPPYIRIQTLKQKDPDIVAFYKEHYASAAKGNYDIYVVFIEAGLRLLKSDGNLAYICPHKFFNADYGESLRGLLARGSNLRHAVHFGDQQVFLGATIYTCLLFLSRAPSASCRYARPDSLPDWLQTFKAAETTILASAISATPWNFTAGRAAAIMGRFSSQPRKLSDVAHKIYQGLVTGADSVFILTNRRKGVFESAATGEEHEIESALMHPLCKGSVDIRRYFVGDLEKSILFPYHIINGDAHLISISDFKAKYPKAWKYLSRNREQLEAREGGKWKHDKWYALGRSQNLAEMEQQKLLTPSIASSASFTLDERGTYYFVGSGGGGGGGYGITVRQDAKLSLSALLGILNSAPADFFLKKVSTPFANGYFAYNRQFIEQIPIPTVEDSNQRTIERLVSILLRTSSLLRGDISAASPRDPLMLAYWEQILNGLVYELYFPEELHAAGLRLFDLVGQAFLPAVPPKDADRNVCTTFLKTLRTKFEELHDIEHPLRAALFSLGNLEIVRIIEGKE